MSDDTISRQVAIDECNKRGAEHIGYAIAHLPSAQPELCEDAVSRRRLLSDLKELIAAWEKYPVMAEQRKGVEAAIGYVAVIPSVTQKPEQRWIPCSERLPDYGVSVLTWDGYCFCVEKRIPTIRDDEGEPITGDWWVSDDYDEYSSDYYPNLRDGACIAWMPLPEPYREEGEK